jgi:hypothetical protein
MRHAIAWLAALVVPALLLAGPAFAQKGKKPVDKDLDKNTTSPKMVKAGVLVGKVAAVYEDKRKIRLSVTISYPKLNTGAYTNYLNAQQSLANAIAKKDVNGIASAQRSMAQAQAQMYTMESKTQDVELEALENAQIRMAKPRQQFDDKGRIKKFTKAELKELKGDPKLRGYKAEFSDVQVEQIIEVTLVRKKGVAAKAPRRPKKGKDKDADADVDIMADNLPQASKIMILVEPPPSK